MPERPAPEIDTVTSEQDIQLKKFNITDVAIEELSSKYLPLSIKDIKDSHNYKLVHAGVQQLRTLRLNVEDKRVELVKPHLEMQRLINKVAKDVTARMEPIETHLNNEKNRIDKLKAAERLKKEKELSDRMEKRVRELMEIGCGYLEDHYFIGNIRCSSKNIKGMNDKHYQKFLFQLRDESTRLKAEQVRAQAKKEMEEKLLESSQQKALIELHKNNEPVLEQVNIDPVIESIPKISFTESNNTQGVEDNSTKVFDGFIDEGEKLQETDEEFYNSNPIESFGENLSGLLNSFQKHLFKDPVDESNILSEDTPICELTWHAVEYAGYYNIQSEPGYGGRDVLNEENFPGKAKVHAELAAAAPKMLRWLRVLNSPQYFFEDVADTINEVNQFIYQFECKDEKNMV